MRGWGGCLRLLAAAAALTVTMSLTGAVVSASSGHAADPLDCRIFPFHPICRGHSTGKRGFAPPLDVAQPSGLAWRNLSKGRTGGTAYRKFAFAPRCRGTTSKRWDVAPTQQSTPEDFERIENSKHNQPEAVDETEPASDDSLDSLPPIYAAGKRSSRPKDVQPKRMNDLAPFSSFYNQAGKRADDLPSSFSSFYGGKRAAELPSSFSSFYTGKRSSEIPTSFSSFYTGKRSSELPSSFSSFYTGKRSSPDALPSSFSSFYAGKRSSEFPGSFSSFYNGKRSAPDALPTGFSSFYHVKRSAMPESFSSFYHGKRSDSFPSSFSSFYNGKRAAELPSSFSSFYPGKRSAELPSSFSSFYPGKRSAADFPSSFSSFYSGKRSLLDDLEDEEDAAVSSAGYAPSPKRKRATSSSDVLLSGFSSFYFPEKKLHTFVENRQSRNDPGQAASFMPFY